MLFQALESLSPLVAIAHVTPLHAEGHVDIVSWLFSQEPALFSKKNKASCTPAMLAAKAGRTEVNVNAAHTSRR